MGETVVIRTYMDRYKREKYISIYKTFQKKHEGSMALLFGDKEGAAKAYRDELREKYSTMFNYEYVDPGDVFEDIQEQAYEFYEAEKLMEYNFHFSLLGTLYQMFEQQLRKFIYEEFNHRTSPVEIKEPFAKYATNMGVIKEEYLRVNYDLEKTPQWDTISLLALLINAYKHGDGGSAKKLYAKKPELFLKAYYGEERVMDQALTTNAEIVFDMEQADFKTFSNAIIDFWEQFPEHLSGQYTFPD